MHDDLNRDDEYVFKTINTDNGSEFEDLSEIEQLGTNVYFAHPYSL